MHNRNAELYELGTLFRSFFWNMQTLLHDDNKIPHRTIAQVFRVIWGQLLYMYCKVQMSLPFTSGAFPALWLKATLEEFLVTQWHNDCWHPWTSNASEQLPSSPIERYQLYLYGLTLLWAQGAAMETTNDRFFALSRFSIPGHRCSAEFQYSTLKITLTLP